MRFLTRLLIFWLIAGPLFYIFGLPIVLEKLNEKTRKEAYSQCVAHLIKEGLMGRQNAALNSDQGDHYCHCVSDDLTIVKEDLLDMVQKKKPAKLTELSKIKNEQCNVNLQKILRARYNAPVDVAPVAPSTLTIIETP